MEQRRKAACISGGGMCKMKRFRSLIGFGRSIGDVERLASATCCDASICETEKSVSGIGSGGNARVYRTTGIKGNWECAVKIAKKGELYRTQFENEKRILKYLAISNCKVSPRLYSGSDNEIVMELISGDTLDKLDVRRCSEFEIKELFLCLCDALLELHGLNPPVIHRDIKPSNIMLDDRGNIRIIDYGTAKILECYGKEIPGAEKECAGVGTRGFAAPEQYGGFDEGIRTDIYQLGQTMEKCLNEAAVSSKFRESMDVIIQRCSSTCIGERYAGAADIKLDILRLKAAKKRKCFIKFCESFQEWNRKNRINTEKEAIFIDIVRTCDSIEFL